MRQREKPHTKSAATRLIKNISRGGGVVLSEHIDEKMHNKNIQMQDILCAFKNGGVTKEATWDIDYEEWKYTFVGNGVDKKKLKIVTNIYKKESEVFVITVY